jgi:hypothetical protein
LSKTHHAQLPKKQENGYFLPLFTISGPQRTTPGWGGPLFVLKKWFLGFKTKAGGSPPIKAISIKGNLPKGKSPITHYVKQYFKKRHLMISQLLFFYSLLHAAIFLKVRLPILLSMCRRITSNKKEAIRLLKKGWNARQMQVHVRCGTTQSNAYASKNKK